jgi:hypothetical protein
LSGSFIAYYEFHQRQLVDGSDPAYTHPGLWSHRAQRAGGYSDAQYTNLPTNRRRDVFTWFLCALREHELATLYSLYEINIRTILEYVATEHPFSGSVETCAKRSLGVDYDYDGLWNYIYKDSGCLISLLFVLAQLSSFFLYLTT